MKVDQSLEDIVKQQLDAKRAARRGARAGGNPRRGSRGPPRGVANRRRNSFGNGSGNGGVKTSSNGAQKSRVFGRDNRRSRSPPPARRERVYVHIANLDFQVSERDLKELFGEFGDLKKADLHYDKSGKSLGTGELCYGSRGAAVKALRQYNGVPLDGRPMKLEILGEDKKSEPVAKRLGARRSFSESPTKRRGGFGGGAPRGARRGGRGGGAAGGKREKKPEPTAEDLDKELDNYLAGASTSN